MTLYQVTSHIKFLLFCLYKKNLFLQYLISVDKADEI